MVVLDATKSNSACSLLWRVIFERMNLIHDIPIFCLSRHIGVYTAINAAHITGDMFIIATTAMMISKILDGTLITPSKYASISREENELISELLR